MSTPTPAGKTGLSAGLTFTVLCGLLAIPTGLLACTLTSPQFASAFRAVWRAGTWQPLLGQAAAGQIALDGFLFLIIAVMGAVFFLAWRRLDWTRISTRQVIGWSMAMALVLVPVGPFHSRDLFGYINRGVELSQFQLNPNKVSVSAIPDWQTHPMLSDHWIDNPSPYGLAFSWVSGKLIDVSLALNHDRSSPQAFLTAVLLFKLANVVVWLALLLTAAWLLRSSPHADSEPMAKRLALLAWNPLLLLHLIANGHNDGWLGLLALAGLATLRLGPAWACLPLLTTSVLVKFTSIVTLPCAALALLAHKRHWSALLVGMTLSLAITAGLWLLLGQVSNPLNLPLANTQDPLWSRLLHNATLSQHSWHAGLTRLVYYTGKLLLGENHPSLDAIRIPATVFCLLTYLGIYLWLLRRLWQARFHREEAIHLAVWAMASLLLLASPKFNAWYLGMLLPLAVLLPTSHLLYRYLFWLSLTLLFAFTPLENLHLFGPLILLGLPAYFTWGWQRV